MEKTKEQVKKSQGHTYRQWTLTGLANAMVFCYGLDVGWISPMAKILQSEKSPTGEPLSDTMLSWIASSVCLAAVFSVPIYSYIADKYGSRASVIAIAVPQAVSWIIRLCFASGPSLIISRIFSGVGAGGCFIGVTIYVKELSQDSIRGTLSSVMLFAQNSGIFVMYIMGIYLDYYTILWIAAGIPIVTPILLLKAPDSPAFLIKQGKIEEAIVTVGFLRGLDKDHKSVLEEITLMKNESEYFKSLPKISLRIIVKNPIWRRGIYVTVMLVTCQALNGAFAVTTFASTILWSTGAGFVVSVDMLTLSIPTALLVGSVVTVFCIEKINRKILIIIMLSITTCSMVSLAVCMLIKHVGGSVPSWLPILSMMVCVWAYSGGISPVPFIVMAEMFSFQIRPKVFGLVLTLSWFTTFLPVVGYMPLSTAVGLHNTFFMFAAVNVFGILLCLLFLPETRAKSVTQIEEDIARSIGLNKMAQNIM